MDEDELLKVALVTTDNANKKDNEIIKKETETILIPVMPIVPLVNSMNTSPNANSFINSSTTVVKEISNETILTTATTAAAVAVNLPLAKPISCTSNTQASSVAANNKPMMIHPATAYSAAYGNSSNFYYFLQLNLLKNSLMQNYYQYQNVNAAKYLSNVNRGYSSNSFILNRNYF